MQLRGQLAHADLWSVLLEDGVSIQWVLSPVGVDGNEQADRQAAKGAKIRQHKVIAHRTVTDVWQGLVFKKCQTHMTQTPMTQGGLRYRMQTKVRWCG